MSYWITDRPPTEADGDKDGDVWVRVRPDRVIGFHMHWSYVGIGTPWRRSQFWLPPAPQPEPEPEPIDAEFTPPAAEIPGPILTGAAPFYVVVASDDSGAGRGGKPITWETQIPEGGTLQAVLRHQLRLGNRYGTTFIAECRIIPELTRDV